MLKLVDSKCPSKRSRLFLLEAVKKKVVNRFDYFETKHASGYLESFTSYNCKVVIGENVIDPNKPIENINFPMAKLATNFQS